jgi:hypothetical protein
VLKVNNNVILVLGQVVRVPSAAIKSDQNVRLKSSIIRKRGLGVPYQLKGWSPLE